MMTDQVEPAVVRPLTPDDIPAVRSLLLGVLAAGELFGSTIHDIEMEVEARQVEPARTLVCLTGSLLVGFFDPDYPLLAVAAEQRRNGHGRSLVERALADATARGADSLELAPPRGSQSAEAFATALGFSYRSSYWQLRLDPASEPPRPAFPATFRPRQLQPGDDDLAYHAVVNTSFADHPTPLTVSLETLQRAHSRPTFNPADIAVVPDPDAPQRLIAFCRTVRKVADDHPAEISLLGVVPEYRGRGLGRELLRWGIEHLRAIGEGEIVLAVESRNRTALTIYEREGFVPRQEWPRWARALA